MTQPRGMPILSGPPPAIESPSCRQCNEKFNFLLRRSKQCGHCGYAYCSTCMEGQALMPRRNRSTGPLSEIREAFRSADQQVSGYDPEPVCANCLGLLKVTATSKDALRTLPLKTLKEYLAAYNIPFVGVVEKEGLVEAAIAARNPATGCLHHEFESNYRRSRQPPRRAPTTPGAYPAGNVPYTPRQPHTRPPPPNYARPPPPTQRPPPPQPRPQASPRPQARPVPAQSQARPAAPAQPRQPQPPAAARPVARPPPPPVPSILSLVSLPDSYLASLSIGTLKAILYENHVRVDFKQVLEKAELIARVAELVTDERKRLERQRREEEREAAAAAGSLAVEKPDAAGGLPTPDSEDAKSVGENSGEGVQEEAAKRVPTGPLPEIDRGLCVVCQDEEATLAVVDCGHLAMCSHCSDLILATSKECPLCRTRIVTPQRLIRIYRV